MSVEIGGGHRDHPGVDDFLPAGAVPLASVRGVAFLNADGKEQFAIAWGADQSILATLGLMNLMEKQFLAEMDLP